MPLHNQRNAPVQGPYFIVMNAGSGDKEVENRQAAIQEVLSRAGRHYRVWLVTDSAQLTEASRQAVELAQQQQGIVVAAGGDGTINTVAQAALEVGCPLGLLPQGTFNYFSRTHGIPLDTAEATQILLHGVVRPVQVGLLNDRLFLINASIGLYPKLLEKREAHKQRFGRTRLVALFSALTTLLTPQRQFTLVVDDGGERQVVRTSGLVVENNPLQLKEVGLVEASAVQRGELAAIVVKAKGVLQMLSLIWSAALGRLGEADEVSTFSFTSLTATPLRRRRIKVATDGEVTRLDAPLKFRVAPHALLLVVPAMPPGEEGT